MIFYRIPITRLFAAQLTPAICSHHPPESTVVRPGFGLQLDYKFLREKKSRGIVSSTASCKRRKLAEVIIIEVEIDEMFRSD
jgi:hypothetical protein